MESIIPAPEQPTSQVSPNERAAPDVRDTCVVAGLFGDDSDVESMLARLRSNETRLLDAEVASYESDTRQGHERLRSLEEQKTRLHEQIQALEVKSAALEEPERVLQARERELAAEKARISSELVAKRTTYVTRALSEKARLYAHVRGEITLQLVTAEKQVLEQQRQLHEIELERRRLNEPELQRRLRLLTEQQDSVRQKLETHEKRIEQLRILGVTRTTSGFLLWAGYLAFGGVGWLLGESIRLSGAPSGLFDVFFSSLGKGVTALVGKIGVLKTILVASIAPLGVLGLCFGLLYLWDYGLRHFDKGWVDRSRRRNDRSGPIRLWIGSAGPSINREHYLDTLARLPLLYMWSLIPVGIAMLTAIAGASMSATSPQDPWQSLLYTYVGIVMVISCTGLAMLYVTQVLEPRRPQLLEWRGVRRTIALNIELIAVTATAAAFLVLYPLLRTWWPTAPALWEPLHSIGAAVLLLTVSFSTAYGLVFLGIFKDLDRLQLELRRFDSELQKYAALPSVDAVDAQTERFRTSLDSLYDDIDRLWATPDWWAFLIGDVPFQRARRFWRTRRKTDPLDLAALGTFTVGDVFFEPDHLSRLFRTNADLEHSRQEIERLQESRRNLGQNLERLRAELTRIDSELEQQRVALDRRRREHHTELDRISVLYGDLIAGARSAFKVGLSLRRGAAPIGQEG